MSTSRERFRGGGKKSLANPGRRRIVDDMQASTHHVFWRHPAGLDRPHLARQRPVVFAGQAVLRRLVCILIVWWVTLDPIAAQVAERYILVLKDGRRIAVSGYETSGDHVYYERFDARIGIKRALVETIQVIPPSQDTPVLEDVILGRVLKIHDRQFTLGDFLREDFFTAEIEPRLSPEEQTAYVRKLISLKRWQILEIEDQWSIAEKKGDIVDLGVREQQLIAALRDLNDGQRALSKLVQRHRAAPARSGSGTRSSGPEENETTAGGDMAANGHPAAEVSIDALMDPAAGRDRLQHQREMLVIVIKKNYDAGEKAGGVLTLQQARQDLRIVDLQIRYFDQLAGVPPTLTAPPLPNP